MIAIIVNREHCSICRIIMMMVVILVSHIDGERAREGVGRMGLAAGVQRPVHHRHGGLNHEHGDQHYGQSRHAFP